MILAETVGTNDIKNTSKNLLVTLSQKGCATLNEHQTGMMAQWGK